MTNRVHSNEAVTRKRQDNYDLAKKATGFGMSRGNTQEVDNNELEFDMAGEGDNQEMKSFGLDTSMLERQLKMPTVNGNRVQLQNEIGHFIQMDTAEVYQEQENRNPD